MCLETYVHVAIIQKGLGYIFWSGSILKSLLLAGM